MPLEPARFDGEEEFPLGLLLFQPLRHPRLFAALLLASLLSGALFLAFAPRTYTVQVLVRVGKVPINPTGDNFTLLPSPEEWMSKLTFWAKSEKRSNPRLVTVRTIQQRPSNLQENTLILLEAKGKDPVATFAHLQKVVRRFYEPELLRYQEIVKSLKDHARFLEEKLRGAEKDYQEYKERISRLSPSSPQYLLLFYDLMNLNARIVQLRSELDRIQMLLKGELIYPPTLATPFLFPVNPSFPNTPIVLLLSLLLGVMVAYFGTFLWDTRQNWFPRIPR